LVTKVVVLVTKALVLVTKVVVLVTKVVVLVTKVVVLVTKALIFVTKVNITLLDLLRYTDRQHCPVSYLAPLRINHESRKITLYILLCINLVFSPLIEDLSYETGT